MLKMKIVLQILFAMAAVLATDVEASNGVVHVNDAVLLPSKSESAIQAGNKTIVDIAVETPTLSTLVKALTAGDLVKTLEGAGPFTVFAPTNAAFDALPAGVLASLLEEKNKAALVKILTYHVLGSDVQSNQLKDGEKVQTLEKGYVTVSVDGKDIRINTAKVTIADVEASNGVVHVIDAVLLPPNATATPTTAAPTTAAPTMAPTTAQTGSPTIGLSIAEFIEQNTNLTELFGAVSPFNSIVKALNNSKKEFILFAPVNSAFAANTNATKKILQYHVIDLDGQDSNLDEGVNYKKSLDDNQILKIIRTQDTKEIQFGYPFKSTGKLPDPVRCNNGDVYLVDMILEPPASSTVVEKAASVEKFGAASPKGPVTIFAVKDKTFDTNKIEDFGSTAQIALAEYSAVQGLISSGLASIPVGTTIVSSLYNNGMTLKIVKKAGKDKKEEITVNGYKVIEADILTNDERVIHVLESPLLVPWSSKMPMVQNIRSIGSYRELLKAVRKADNAVFKFLKNTTVKKTLFAPSGDSLLLANASNLDQALLTDILLYHVVDGKHNASELSQGVHWESKLADKNLADAKQVVIVTGYDSPTSLGQVNSQVLINKAFESTDGFVYNIPNILAIPGSFEDQIRNIEKGKVGVDDGIPMTTFTSLLNLTNLTSTLLELKDITIFAPDDDAFKAYFSAESLDPATIDGQAAKTLLLEHVFQGQALYSNDLFNGVRTNLTIYNKTWQIDSKSLTIGGAPVEKANNLVKNGVIHVLKRVLGAPPVSPATDSKSGLTGGEIVGIVVGVLAFIAIIGYCCFKSKKQQQDDYQHI